MPPASRRLLERRAEACAPFWLWVWVSALESELEAKIAEPQTPGPFGVRAPAACVGEGARLVSERKVLEERERRRRGALLSGRHGQHEQHRLEEPGRGSLPSQKAASSGRARSLVRSPPHRKGREGRRPALARGAGAIRRGGRWTPQKPFFSGDSSAVGRDFVTRSHEPLLQSFGQEGARQRRTHLASGAFWGFGR